MRIRLGTRGSQLARQQAAQVASCLEQEGAVVEIVVISTTGDRHQEGLPPLGETRGIFTRELQEALLAGRIDVAVHSLKDLPTGERAGLRIAAILPRESPFDLVVFSGPGGLELLSQPLRVGTSSSRRQAQLRYLFPQLRLEPIRGNVDTRLRKLREGQYDAIVLAEAGLSRLGLVPHYCERLPGAFMLPAPGQGAIAVELAAEASAIAQLVGRLDDFPTRAAVEAERAFLHYLKGGCLAPVAALGVIRGDRLILAGRVLSPDGSRRIDGTLSDRPTAAESLGEKLADQLRSQGAAECIALARQGDKLG